MKSHI